jgi:hypothetical protein
MTAAELRVLETRMDLLETVLQELIEQVRRMQLSGWNGQRRAVGGLSAGLVVKGLFQVAADGFENRAGHEFIGLRKVNPAYLG